LQDFWKWSIEAYKGSLVVARGKKDQNLYLLQARRLSQGFVNAVEEEKCTELWHKRLGHMSQKGLRGRTDSQV
jgi:hypothetical protein